MQNKINSQIFHDVQCSANVRPGDAGVLNRMTDMTGPTTRTRDEFAPETLSPEVRRNATPHQVNGIRYESWPVRVVTVSGEFCTVETV